MNLMIIINLQEKNRKVGLIDEGIKGIGYRVYSCSLCHCMNISCEKFIHYS